MATSIELSKKTRKSWTKNWKSTSHFEGYIAAIQEQDIPAKYLINKRARDAAKEPPFMSARYYLPVRHDMVAKTLYKEIIKKTTQKLNFPRKSMNKSTYKK